MSGDDLPRDTRAERVAAEARAVTSARAKRDDIAPADRWSAVAFGAGFVVACVVGVARVDSIDGTTLATLGIICVLHALASLVTFESAAGIATATQPILVAALLLLPAGLVFISVLPTVVLLGLVMPGRSAEPPARRGHLVLLELMTCWHCVGPALVLAWADLDGVALHHLPVYLLALGAQFATDALVSAVRCAVLGLPLRELPRPLAWSAAVDTLLAAIGLAAVLACDASLWSLPFVAAPVALLALVVRDRTEHLEKAVVISEAFEAAVSAARSDVLTDLRNRRAWSEATARAALAFAADPGATTVTVLMGDLDGLKAVNDALGHDAGDQLINAAADALRLAAPPGAIVARLGGDEFGILVVGEVVDHHELIAHIRATLAEQPTVRGFPLSLSLGVASCPPLRSVEAALAAADEGVFVDKAARSAGRR
jgi:diguanylate cyclase (GGDEF)-like protein